MNTFLKDTNYLENHVKIYENGAMLEVASSNIKFITKTKQIYNIKFLKPNDAQEILLPLYIKGLFLAYSCYINKLKEYTTLFPAITIDCEYNKPNSNKIFRRTIAIKIEHNYLANDNDSNLRTVCWSIVS